MPSEFAHPPPTLTPAPGVAAPVARDGPHRLAALDGLRALSILIVLVGHAAWTAGAPDWLAPLRDYGIVGVEIFFAISGYIITHLLLRERARTGHIDLRGFWWRRAVRIVPALLATAFGIGLSAALGHQQWHWGSFLGALSLTKDTPLMPGDWFFGHVWSLALEEQFYLLWPLLLLLLAPRGDGRRASAWLWALWLLSPVLAVTPRWLPELENILPYLPYLGAGCLLALVTSRRGNWLKSQAQHRSRRTVALVVVGLAAVVAWLDIARRWLGFMQPLDGLLGPCAAFMLVAYAVLAPRARVLASWPFRSLGRISYGVYLWQQLFLGPPHVYLHPWRWTFWPLNVLAAVGCGAASYWLIERPSGRLKRSFRTGPDRQRVRQPPAAVVTASSGTPSP